MDVLAKRANYNNHYKLFERMKTLFHACIIIIALTSCEYFILKNKANENATRGNDLGEKKMFTGVRESHHENGKLSAAVEYVDGKRHGLARDFYENGSLKLEMHYDHGKKHGAALTYDEKGKLAKESYYTNDELDGVRKIYSKGKIRAEIPYKNGKPGKGLIEYLVNGELKTKYPTITVTPVDDRAESGYCHLQIEFTEVDPRDEFYLGNLVEGKYVHSKMEVINGRQGRAKISMPAPSGSVVMQEMNIVGVHYTLSGNTYVTSTKYNLRIE